MALVEPQTGPSSLSKAIEVAEGQLTDLTALAGELLEEIKAGNLDTVKDAAKAADELRKILRLAIELEVRNERDRKREAGVSGSYGLDLEQARADIGCKLGRLRRCCRAGEVSG